MINEYKGKTRKKIISIKKLKKKKLKNKKIKTKKILSKNRN